MSPALHGPVEQILAVHANRFDCRVALGWLLSLVSANIFVIIGVGTMGVIVGVVLGIIHRNDP
jgi:hypothetical protein